MNRFAILIDSTGDLNKDLRAKYDIDYCTMGISIDGKDYPASLDWDQGMTPHELYDLMRQGMKFFTSQVTAQEFESKFQNTSIKGKMSTTSPAPRDFRAQSISLAASLRKLEPFIRPQDRLLRFAHLGLRPRGDGHHRQQDAR
jgi:hypothetical protein